VRGHVSAETLAAFREDLLPRRKAARVSAHLAACPRCAGLDAQLAEVPALLARPAATPMPAALTVRIEAALAAEAAARSAATADAVPATAMADAATATASAAGAGAGSGRDRDRRRADRAARPPGRDRSGLALRIAVATAAVLILGGGGYGAARLLSGSPAVTSAASGGGAVGAHRSAGFGPRISGVSGAPAALPDGGYPVYHSGTDYLPSRLGTQIRAVVPPVNRSPSSGAGTSAGASKNRHESAAPTLLFPDLNACVARVAGGKHPVFVDVASYRGRPAAVIAVAGPGPGTLRVLIVGTGCNAAASDLLATTTLPVSR
jgi:hypothetical protein